MLPPDDDDDASDESDEKEDEPPEDKIFAEFTKVNRTRMKFKCDFKNAILHINGHDYVIKNLQGDIDYWFQLFPTSFIMDYLINDQPSI